jgi:hypothetical protein
MAENEPNTPWSMFWSQFRRRFVDRQTDLPAKTTHQTHKKPAKDPSGTHTVFSRTVDKKDISVATKPRRRTTKTIAFFTKSQVFPLVSLVSLYSISFP